MNRQEVIKELKSLYQSTKDIDDIKTGMSLLKLIGLELGMFRQKPTALSLSIKDLTDAELDALIESVHAEDRP
jgi:histidinol phosphatase-like PHP family hydrolase